MLEAVETKNRIQRSVFDRKCHCLSVTLEDPVAPLSRDGSRWAIDLDAP